MSYDARGSLVTNQDALGRRTSFSYDAVGNEVRRVDGRGLVTTLSYDALDRLTRQQFASGRLTSFAYDAAGQRTLMTDQSGVTSTSYDGNGRLQSVAAPSTGTLTYLYDRAGNRTQMLEPRGGTTTSSYDGNDRLTRLHNPLAEVTSFVYDALDRETNRTLANGVGEQRGYDADGRLTSLNAQNSAGAMLLRHTLSYDRVGNVLTQQELDGALTSYSYDASDQLTSEARSGSNAYSRSYSYDAAGNRLSQNANGVVTTSTYDAANQLLTSQNGSLTTTYTYDGAGNRTLENANGAVTSFSWNEENKLVRLSLPSGEVQSLVYSGEGDLRRRVVAVNGVTQSDVRLLKDGLVVLQEQDAATGNVLRRYTNGGGEWGNLISLAQGDAGLFNQSLFNAARFNVPRAARFLISDQLGSTRLLLDGAGAITDTSLASGFGEELAASGSSPNLFWFGGNWQYLRLRLNLLLAGKRVYDAETGTWMSLDPIGFWGGDANLFRSVQNNPVNWVDPEGLRGRRPGGITMTVRPPSRFNQGPTIIRNLTPSQAQDIRSRINVCPLDWNPPYYPGSVDNSFVRPRSTSGADGRNADRMRDWLVDYAVNHVPGCRDRYWAACPPSSGAPSPAPGGARPTVPSASQRPQSPTSRRDPCQHPELMSLTGCDELCRDQRNGDPVSQVDVWQCCQSLLSNGGFIVPGFSSPDIPRTRFGGSGSSSLETRACEEALCRLYGGCIGE